MDAEEAQLRFALLAAAPDGRRDFSAHATQQAILAIPGVRVNDFTIRRFAPESFLIVFASQRSRDAALDAKSVRVGNAQLLLRPWTRLVRASHRPLRQRVTLEIEGIPAHAWSLRVAQKLLASSCWVERLEPSAADRSDMSFMELTAWTDDPSAIPKRKRLIIAEHEQPVVHADPEVQRIFANTRPYLREKNTLQYEVLIHLRRIADFSPRSPSPSPGPSPPSSNGDSGHDGNPDRGYGESRGDGGPRLHGFPPVYGRADGEDRSGGGPSEAASERGRGAGSHRRSARSSSMPAPRSVAPARMTSTTASFGDLSRPGRPSGKASSASILMQATSQADATKPLCAEASPQLPDSQLGSGQAAALEETNGNSAFPKRATDNSCELVAFESQIPLRHAATFQTQDPMLFEFKATRPVRKLDKLPDATRTGLRTYKRRPRSVAATVAAEAALQLEPATAHPEPTEPFSSEPAESGGDDAAGPARDTTTPAQLGPATSPGPLAEKRSRAERRAADRPEATSSKQARLDEGIELERAKEATAAFLASVSHALQMPLAALPPRQTTASPSTAPRRSTRLAGKTLNSSVRASKKGEVLVKRKLGLCSDDGSSEQELASVFRGPLETSHYASLRDIFPAARALSDTELVAAAMQASQAVCAC
ncbi:unnamed protein product [Urochloa humidicola]